MKTLIIFGLILAIFSCSDKKSNSTPPIITCMTTNAVMDVSGNQYTSIKIGSQEWLVENLKTESYRDGTAIPNLTSAVAWDAVASGAWCYFDNNVSNDNLFGKLYNWEAVNDARGLAPAGWHVPSDAEWKTLIDFLGGNDEAGRKLKEIGIAHWLSDNSGTITSTNSSCFTGLPGGYRNDDVSATFSNFSSNGYWWSTTDAGGGSAGSFILTHATPRADQNTASKAVGYSVRCLKN